MNYADAVQSCLSGKLMTRPEWSNEGAYIINLPGLRCFIKAKTKPGQDVGPWLAHIDDSNAEDWMVFDPAAKEEIVDLVEAVQVA